MAPVVALYDVTVPLKLPTTPFATLTLLFAFRERPGFIEREIPVAKAGLNTTADGFMTMGCDMTRAAVVPISFAYTV